ncbi:MAG: methyltransferase [Magnetococcales bacterium]|nr:methyltransferase [Magnetococcales bacterium]
MTKKAHTGGKGGDREGLTTVATLLLASGVKPENGLRLAELGAGSAEAAIRVAKRLPQSRIDCLERQPPLYEMARERIDQEGLGDRVRIFLGDVRAPPAGMRRESYDQVFCNPPFFKVGEGRLPPDPIRAHARFELSGTLHDFIRCGASLLKTGGRFHLVHLPRRRQALLTCLTSVGLTPDRLTPVAHASGRLPFLDLVRGCKGGEAPLRLDPIHLLGDMEEAAMDTFF